MGGEMTAKIGSFAFILGVLIAVVAGLINLDGQTKAIMTSLLIVLGLIVGFLNVTGKETTPFLLAAVSLVIVTNFGSNQLGQIQMVGSYIDSIFKSIMTFVIPATIIVAMKAIYALASDE